jgi:hypothetical protein
MAKRRFSAWEDDYPNLAREWHPTKNGALTPSTVSRGSDRRVWWLCPVDPSHEWPATICNRLKPAGCPYCAGKLATRKTCLAAVSPGLAKQWHPAKNGAISPASILPHSNKKFWWLCPKDPHHEWEATPNNRSNGRGCPVCAGKKVIPATSLAVLYPALASEWHSDLNGELLPSDLRPASNVDVWWKCKADPEHVWSTSPNKRTAGRGCPYCAGKAVMYSNSLAALHPEVAAEWNYARNTISPEEVRPGSDKIVWWTCSKEASHSWPARVANRANQGTGCPYCSGLLATPETSLANLYPEIAVEWHPDRNREATPHDVRPQSNKRQWWRCRQNSQHEWQATVQSRVLGTGCPKCSRHSASIETCLATINPSLAREWHPTKNNSLTPLDVLPGSSHSVWWQCANNPSHEWEAVIAWRTRGISCCPMCASLAVVLPHLAEEWHPTKNGLLTAETITPGSGQKVWWQCRYDRSHEWDAVVSSRSRGNGCPMCAGKAVTPETCLATVCPEIAKEWHPTKNGTLTPLDVTRGSGRKVWWRCSRNDKHEWDALICNRSAGVGCPLCTLIPRSKNEVYLAWELKLFFDFDVDEHKLKCGDRIMDVDILIPSLDLVLEYDGSYWHADSQERDREKTLLLEQSGYHVIRIREEPLQPLGALDAVVQQQDYKGAANAALLMIECLLDGTLPGVAEYVSEPNLMNRSAANVYIERLLDQKAGKAAS